MIKAVKPSSAQTNIPHLLFVRNFETLFLFCAENYFGHILGSSWYHPKYNSGVINYYVCLISTFITTKLLYLLVDLLVGSASEDCSSREWVSPDVPTQRGFKGLEVFAINQFLAFGSDRCIAWHLLNKLTFPFLDLQQGRLILHT